MLYEISKRLSAFATTKLFEKATDSVSLAS